MDAGTSIALLVAGLAGAGVGAWLAARRLGRRLRATTDAVARLGEGDVEVRAEAGGQPDAAALATAVNAAAERLGRQVRALRREQRVRDLILSSMQEGVLLVDGGGVVFANDAIDRHLRGRPASAQQLHPAAFRDAVERAAESRQAVSVEVEMTAPSAWLRGTAVPASEGSAVLLVVRDVTEAKRIDAVRRDFVANASHELKTPAASIQATAETIRVAAADDPAVIPRFAEQLDREAIRLSRIVADLLDLSRLETGGDGEEEVRLDALVREETPRLQDTARAADVELEVDAAPVPAIRARDATLLCASATSSATRSATRSRVAAWRWPSSKARPETSC